MGKWLDFEEEARLDVLPPASEGGGGGGTWQGLRYVKRIHSVGASVFQVGLCCSGPNGMRSCQISPTRRDTEWLSAHVSTSYSITVDYLYLTVTRSVHKGFIDIYGICMNCAVAFMLFCCCLSCREGKREKASVQRMWLRGKKNKKNKKKRKWNALCTANKPNNQPSVFIWFTSLYLRDSGLYQQQWVAWSSTQSGPLTSQCCVPHGRKWWTLATLIRPLWLIKYFLWYKSWREKALKRKEKKDACNSFAARQRPRFHGVVVMCLTNK